MLRSCLSLSALLLFSIVGETRAVDFARDIRPILSDKCFFCHGPDRKHRKADLRLDVREEAFSDRDGVTAFVPGDLGKSESWWRITSTDSDDVMPPPDANKPLTEAEKDLIRQWIESGAEWTEHWSFSQPEKPVPPRPATDDLHPIDRFVLDRLDEEGLAPGTLADRRTLIRRITFDLTGLPPTPEEVEAFISDESGEAWTRVVDRLLASPHFGERMALMWLDAARYGDTSVMHADGPRDMWPWRDWVIDAYNRNRPYDQFSIEQLAGDLLPDPTNAQLIATGFNRNHPSSDEGGAIPEELRVGYVADRVKTTSNVWLGLSMECAQCHDHKYDPISHEEYFQFYAYFNNTADPGMQTRKGNEAPVVPVLDEEREESLDKLEAILEPQSELVSRAHSEALAGEAPSGSKSRAEEIEERLDDLDHYFPLDESGGRALLDIRGGRDVVGEEPLLSVEARDGERGIELDGERVFDTRSFPDYGDRKKLTLSAWIRIDDAKARGAVFSKMDSARKHRGFDLWMEDGKPGVHLVHSWPGNALKVVSKTALTPGQWHHVAVTYKGSQKPDGVAIYIDGEPVETTHEGEKLTRDMDTAAPFRIGGRFDGDRFVGRVDDIRIYTRALKPDQIEWTREDILAQAWNTLAEERTDAQEEMVENARLARSGDYLAARAGQIELENEKAALVAGLPTTMVMQDNPPGKMRETFLLDRGQYDSPVEDEVIEPGVPAILPPLPADAPKNRLALANWLFADEHPLTSRVAVNQLWQLFFGHGIVRTPADFGAQGAFPTHPELLDWLAVDFRESGWNVKRMIRQIVLTEAYRRTSNVKPEALERDPGNRFLARAPRFRLQAEMIRDNALALSGLLIEESGGPGVKPYQPPGLWAEVSLGGSSKFVQDEGEKLYRRTLYTYWKRSAPPPSMALFDAPTRETCVIQRPRTNTPLQALAAMNDVQMIEASRHLAARILKEGGEAPEARARWAFELATARPPDATETAALLDVFEHGLADYSAHPAKAADLLSAGDSPRDETLPADQHAAWTLVASMILNLDEVLTRN